MDDRRSAVLKTCEPGFKSERKNCRTGDMKSEDYERKDRRTERTKRERKDCRTMKVEDLERKDHPTGRYEGCRFGTEGPLDGAV